jgi:hypothetical protein
MRVEAKKYRKQQIAETKQGGLSAYPPFTKQVTVERGFRILDTIVPSSCNLKSGKPQKKPKTRYNPSHVDRGPARSTGY